MELRSDEHDTDIVLAFVNWEMRTMVEMENEAQFEIVFHSMLDRISEWRQDKPERLKRREVLLREEGWDDGFELRVPLSSILSEQSCPRNSKSGAAVQEIRLAGNHYHSQQCLLSSTTMDVIGEGARMSHTWSIWPEQNTESQNHDAAANDMDDTSKFMFVISNSTIGMSSVSLDSGWAGTSIAKIWCSSLSIGSSAIVSNWECSPFVVMCCSREEGSSLSFFDVSHTSSDKWTLLPLASLSSSPHSAPIAPPCSRLRMDVSLSCSGLSIDDTCLVSESGPLVSSSPSQTDSPICLVSTALSSARLWNVTHSPSLRQCDQSVVSLSSQLLIGCRVMNSSNFLSGTTCRDFNEGGNLLASNTSFTSCTIDDSTRISKHFTTLQEISANTHTFQLCTFKGCTSTTSGVISILSSLTLFLTQCSFDSCEAKTGAGSAVILSSSSHHPVTLVVTSSSFVDGKAFGGSGGTFHLTCPELFSLSDSVFLRSSANLRGGAIFLDATSSRSTTTSISNCLFKECRSNISSSNIMHGGGAIHFSTYPTFKLNSLFFRDNFAVSENGHDIYFNASIPSLTAQTMSNCFSTATPAEKRFHPTTFQQTTFLPTPTNTRTLHVFDASSVAEGSATLSVRLDSPVSGKLLLLVDNTGGSREPEVGQAPLIGRTLMFTLSSSNVAECVVNTGESGLMQCPLDDYRVIEASIPGYLIKIPTVQTILAPTYDGMMKTARLEIRGNELEGSITLTFSGNGTAGNFVATVTFTESVGTLDGILFDALTPSNVNLKYNTKYTLVSAFQGSDPVLFWSGLSFIIEAEPSRLLSVQSTIDTDQKRMTLTLQSHLLEAGSEYSILVVGTPTVPSGSNDKHSNTLKITPSFADSNTLSVPLYPFPGDLLYGYTYSVEEMKITGGSSTVLFEKSTCVFSTPTEPTRLVKFAEGLYDDEKKRIEFVMTGRVLDEEATYKVEVSASASVNHTIEMTYNKSSGEWEGSAVLYPSSEAELLYGTTYTVRSFRKGTDSAELLRDALEEIEIMDEPARLVSTSSKVNVGENGTTLTLTSRSLSIGSEYSIVVVGTPTETSGSNSEHTTTLTVTATSATLTTHLVSLYPDSELKYGYTYSVKEMNKSSEMSPVLIEGLTCVFSTPTEPTRLVTFTKGEYDDEKKTIGFVMTGRVLDEEATYKVVLRASDTVNHTIEMTYKSSGEWEGSAVLYPSSEAELLYGTTYTVSSFRKGSETVELLRDAQEEIEIMAEPARLVSTSSKVNVGSNGTTLTLTSRSLSIGSEYSIVVVGTPTETSGSNAEHTTTLKITPSSATSNTLPVSLYPVSELKYGYTYSVEEMKITGGSSSVLIEKSTCVFSTPAEPERLVSASCAFSFSDSQQSKVSLSFASNALLANTHYTITVQSTAISSIPSHTKTLTVTTENDGSIASFDRCLYPIEEGSKRGEQLEFGLTYTVFSFERGSTSLLFDTESHSFDVPIEPPRIERALPSLNSRDLILSIQLVGRALHTGVYTMSFIDSLGSTQNLSHSFELNSPLVFSCAIGGVAGSAIQFGSTYTITKVEVDESEIVVNTHTHFTVPSPSVLSSAELTFHNSLSTSCVLTVTGSNFVHDEDFVVSLTPPCTIPIRFSTPSSGKTSVMGIGWIDSVEFDEEYRITSIESVSGLDVVVMSKPFVLPALSRPLEVILTVDSSSSDSSLFCGLATNPCSSLDVGWLIVRKGKHTRSSLRIIDSASLSSSLSVPKGSHVMVSNGTSVKSTFRVPSDAASVSGEGLISVSSAFFDLLNLHVLIECTSPTFCLLLCVDSTVELDNIQLSVSQSPTVGNDDAFECGWDHAAIELVNCSTEISNSKLTRLSQGAIQISHGHLSIESCSFHDNSPNHQDFPSLRRNVVCSEGGEVDVGTLTGGDGFEGSSGWFWLDDCSQTGNGLPQESALFVPSLSSQSKAVSDKKSKGFEIWIVGTTLIPCGLWLEVFEILKDGKEGNSTQIALTLECTSSFVESEVRMIVSESDLSSLSSKLEWKGRLVFGKNQTTDSFLIQASSSERISQAMKDNMKWWIPLVAGLAFALLLVIFIVVVCIRRRRNLKTQKDETQVQELDDMNEKPELNVENEQQLVVAASAEHKSHPSASQPFSTMDAGFSNGTTNDKPEMELCLVCAEPFNTVFVEKKPTLFNILHEQRTPLVDRRTAEIQLSKGVEYVSKAFAGCSLLSTLTSHLVCVGSDGTMLLRMTNSSVDAVKEQPQPFENSIVPFDPHNVYMPQPEPSIVPTMSGFADESHLTRIPRSVDDGKRWQAPEEGKPDQPFDTRHAAVFRLGLVLFEIETGCVPFGENDAVNAHRNLEIGILPKMEGVMGEEMRNLITSSCFSRRSVP
ncbi:hypothetical protein BLNAU_14114 [Blattamonas nauphoetae]|uniref:Uncharacterized protein n=1 Tax=Blattamonas nauphoetae TaxID=2049346 RepID=A0ABQ9XHK9_9EUKA|nr:hypothetical protein BLNAU_14114 [Blattamonas nauphoetae]